MTYLKSIGQSYTTTDALQNGLGRGLLKDAAGNPVPPDMLAETLTKHPKLVMRQTIGVLDKIIQKRRALRDMTYETYVHRAKLAERLWRALVEVYSDLNVELSKDDLDELREIWRAKAHPYRLHTDGGLNANGDKNANHLSDLAAKSADDPKPFETFQGKWFDIFWDQNSPEQDYSKIADAVMHHLFVQEILIKGKPRQKDQKATEKGLLTARAEAASTSTSDPRKISKKSKYAWNLQTAEAYFSKTDLVASIHENALQLDPLKPLNAEWFGAQIGSHFGDLGFDKDSFAYTNGPEGDEKRQSLWNFHNEVRGFYKSLSKQARFKIAVRGARAGDEAELKKLQHILPLNKSVLISRLMNKSAKTGELGPQNPSAHGGKALQAHGNAEMGQAIRLGKLTIHAADAISDDNRSRFTDFEAAMDHFVTSAGQSEIKRLETSARVWRKATALSLRTLKGLVDPNGKAADTKNSDDKDIAQLQVAVSAYGLLSDPGSQSHTSEHLKLIFGNKPHEFNASLTSRSSLFEPTDNDHQNETIWALMRITSQIRHSVFHFNVRRRLLKNMKAGFLTTNDRPWPITSDNHEQLQHRSKEMSSRAASTLTQLLDYDQSLQRIALLEELKQIKADQFVSNDQIRSFIEGLSDEDETVLLPKFKLVMQKVQNLRKADDTKLHENLQVFETVVVGNEPKADEPQNMCKLGLFRMLYNSGFRAWLMKNGQDPDILRFAIDKVIQSKDLRVDAFQKERGRRIDTASDLAEHLGLNEINNLSELFSKLTSDAMHASGEDKKYTSNRNAVRGQAANIEDFRKELIAHLFAQYLGQDDHDFGWISSISDSTAPQNTNLETAVQAYVPSSKNYNQSWHSQFYAWLYLVPPEEASKLRHQICKTIALEAKAEPTKDGVIDDALEESIAVLNDITGLIGLYTRVQSVGFQGDEHKGTLLKQAKLYEDPAKFDLVYDDDPKQDKYSLAGTRRGLRQLVRFSHLDALAPVFRKHLVTDVEVESFTSRSAPENQQLFSGYHTLRDDILKAEKSKTPKDDKALINAKPRNIATYKATATSIMAHNFDVNAARLTDHVRLHRMMMELIGRLTDYTAMWERDRIYALIGFLQLTGKFIHFELTTKSDDNKSIVLTAKRSEPEAALEVTLYSRQKGFGAFSENIGVLLNQLPESQRAVLRRFFVDVDGTENPLDEKARLTAERAREQWRSKPGRISGRARKQTIRNDLVHQNILENLKDWKGVQLTYTMNAVRSLMAYDKKMKNAVSKSMKRIVGDYGLEIAWQMGKQDRLTKPQVTPAKETHLGFCRTNRDEENIHFDLPRASPRFVSMAQSLFDFGVSGHAVKIEEAGNEVGRIIVYNSSALEGFSGNIDLIRTISKRKFRFRNQLNN